MEEEKQAPQTTPQTAPQAAKKKKKPKFVDDGHTVYSMEGLDPAPRVKESDKVGLTRKERRAAIRAALAVYMPRVLLIVACFAAAALLIYFWLS